ncbi:MAG: hypothetical protein RPV21_16330 [Candidatus Sedimenticola sp. (ex Thyasira tokunagai)]
MALTGIPLNQWNGSDATIKLEETVLALSNAANRQTSHIIKLTYAMLFLTFIMACMVGVQIWLAFQQTETMKQTENIPAVVLSPQPSQAQTVKDHLPVKNSNPPSLKKAQPEKD